MSPDDYLQKRLEEQINWYSDKSGWNQRWHKGLRLAEICSAALIPFLSGMGERVPCGPWIIGILGVLIAIAAATAYLFKFHENWIHFRTTSEQLKHEKFLFLTGTRPYDDDNKFALLVERVENLISRENSSWAQTAKKDAKATDRT